MVASNSESTATADREIVITREIKAPRELVFQAWTQPEHIANWWGPTGFTTTIDEMDTRPGGAWRFVLHGPGGVEYPSNIVVVEVVPPERLVYDYGSGQPGDEANDVRTRITLTAQGDKTLLTMQLVFSSAAIRQQRVEQGYAVQGATQAVDSLEAYVATL